MKRQTSALMSVPACYITYSDMITLVSIKFYWKPLLIIDIVSIYVCTFLHRLQTSLRRSEIGQMYNRSRI